LCLFIVCGLQVSSCVNEFGDQPSVWNLQPHVRLIHQKEHQRLDNQILVEEKQHDTHPIKEHQLGEPVQEVTVNYLHHVEVVVQHSSKWQDMIPRSDYQNFGERHQRTLKSTYSSVRRYGKQRRS
jgi:hypothetical protein